jgi:hypothetical protein
VNVSEEELSEKRNHLKRMTEDKLTEIRGKYAELEADLKRDVREK